MSTTANGQQRWRHPFTVLGISADEEISPKLVNRARKRIEADAAIAGGLGPDERQAIEDACEHLATTDGVTFCVDLWKDEDLRGFLEDHDLPRLASVGKRKYYQSPHFEIIRPRIKPAFHDAIVGLRSNDRDEESYRALHNILQREDLANWRLGEAATAVCVEAAANLKSIAARIEEGTSDPDDAIALDVISHINARLYNAYPDSFEGSRLQIGRQARYIASKMINGYGAVRPAHAVLEALTALHLPESEAQQVREACEHASIEVRRTDLRGRFGNAIKALEDERNRRIQSLSPQSIGFIERATELTAYIRSGCSHFPDELREQILDETSIEIRSFSIDLWNSEKNSHESIILLKLALEITGTDSLKGRIAEDLKGIAKQIGSVVTEMVKAASAALENVQKAVAKVGEGQVDTAKVQAAVQRVLKAVMDEPATRMASLLGQYDCELAAAMKAWIHALSRLVIDSPNDGWKCITPVKTVRRLVFNHVRLYDASWPGISELAGALQPFVNKEVKETRLSFGILAVLGAAVVAYFWINAPENERPSPPYVAQATNHTAAVTTPGRSGQVSAESRIPSALVTNDEKPIDYSKFINQAIASGFEKLYYSEEDLPVAFIALRAISDPALDDQLASRFKSDLPDRDRWRVLVGLRDRAEHNASPKSVSNARSVFLDALSDPGTWVQLEAADGLGDIGFREDIARLQATARASEPIVKAYAQASAQRISLRYMRPLPALTTRRSVLPIGVASEQDIYDAKRMQIIFDSINLRIANNAVDRHNSLINAFNIRYGQYKYQKPDMNRALARIASDRALILLQGEALLKNINEGGALP